MSEITHYPIVVFFLSLLILWVSARAGFRFRTLVHAETREDFGLILGATLTLSGLIIAFSFSMATDRYNQRKNLEEEEANAIGTEYLRADLLPSDACDKVRVLLVQYLDQRILFYSTRELHEARQINVETSKLQAELWAAVSAPALAHQTPVTALAVTGMNDVINSQGYTQAGYWNRIPISAWAMMVGIAIGCNFLIGFGSRSHKVSKLLIILPAVASVAFMLIADIDTPRHGIIRVKPVNLMSLADSLRSG